MNEEYKVGDLVRSMFMKGFGIIVSGLERHRLVAGGHETYYYCIHWVEKGETTETNVLWLLPFKGKDPETEDGI